MRKSDFGKAEKHFLAISGLLSIAILYSWPVLSQFTTAIPGTPEFADITEYIWNVGWIRKSLTTDVPLFFTDMMFIPFGADLRLNTFGLLQGLMAFPFTSIFGVVGAFNLILVTTLALNGIVTYALFQYQVRNVAAAFIAASWFMLGQPVLSQIRVGRTALGGIWIVSGVLLTLISLIEKPSYWKGFVLGLLLVLALLSDFQIVLFCAIWLALYTSYQVFRQRRGFFQKERLFPLIGAVTFFLIPFVLLYFPSLIGAEANGYSVPGFESMKVYSFQLKHYFMLKLWWYIAGSYLYAIVSVLALLIFRWQRPYRFWFISVIVFMILALGPYLQPTEIPMPFAFFGLWEPFRQFRTPNRLLLPALIGIGMITTYVLAYVRDFIRSRFLLVIVIAIAVSAQYAFAQFNTPFIVQQYPDYEIYSQIGAETDDFALLEVPFSIRSGLRQFGYGGEVVQYYQHIHDKKLLSGSMARLPTAFFEYYQQFPSLVFLTGSEEISTDPNELEADFSSVLTWSNSRYVLLHGSLLDEDKFQQIKTFLDGHPRITQIGMEKDVIIYRTAD